MAEAGKRHVHTNGGTSHITPYSTRYASRQDIPKFRIPEKGAPADAVYQILKDELDLDGKPNLNLARYVITLPISPHRGHELMSVSQLRRDFHGVPSRAIDG